LSYPFAPGEVQVAVRHEKYVAAAATATVTADQETALEIKLAPARPPGGTVTGRAVDMQRRLGVGELSLDHPAGPESDEPLAHTIASGDPGIDDQLADQQLKQLFQSALHEFSGGLKPRDREILSERILSEEPKTLEALGERYKISKERVRQLEANIMKKLKKFMSSRLKPPIDFK
jgi:RNA polymerase sigma factor (sigma-70 family)